MTAELSTKSMACLIGYAVFTTIGLIHIGDAGTGAFAMQLIGSWVVGCYCGYRDHIED